MLDIYRITDITNQFKVGESSNYSEVKSMQQIHIIIMMGFLLCTGGIASLLSNSSPYLKTRSLTTRLTRKPPLRIYQKCVFSTYRSRIWNIKSANKIKIR